MKHALRIEITTYHPNYRGPHVETIVQAVEDEDFDPENRGTLNLAAAAWDEVIANTDLRQTFINVREDRDYTEDDRITIYFDGKPIADEHIANIDTDYFDDMEVTA